MKLKAVLALTATLMLGAAAAQGTTAAPAQAPMLSDVPAGHWAQDAVQRLTEAGIILGFPDGTYRGTENLTRYQAAVIIARLLDRIATGDAPEVAANPELMQSLQNAVQELAADLAALGVRVADLEENAATKEDIARIEDRLNDLGVAGGDESAVADLRAQLDELAARVDELSSNFDTLRADVDDNASSIAALNDLTVLLNQDILSLQDRVSALETGKADRADVENLQGRVTALEANPVVSLTGGFSATFGGVGYTGTAFDIDRLTINTFAGALGNGNVTTVEPAGPATAGATLTFGLGVRNIRTTNNTFVINQANLNFGVANVFGAPGTATGVSLNSADVTGTIAGQPFGVVYSATNSSFVFNRLFMNNANSGTRGAVATIQANTLPFAPKLTVVAGTGLAPTAAAIGTPALPGAYFGVRAEANPFGVGNLGLSYATNSVRDGFSADANFNVGGLALNSVYVTSMPRTGAAADTAFYVAATTNLGGFNIGGNFRTIDADFATPTTAADAVAMPFQPAGMGANTSGFANGATGFGFGVNTNLGIATLGGYFDNNTVIATGATTSNFGVNASANIFRGLTLQGFYNSSTTAGAANPGSSVDLNANYTQVGQTLAPAPLFGTSTFGVVLRHNGKAADALVSGLNLAVGYANFYTVGASDIQVFGDYNANLGVATLSPFARYHTNTGATGLGGAYSTFKVGTQLSTGQLATVFSPSLTGGVSYRSTSFAAGGATTELYANGNLVLNNIFAANTSLGFGYSTYAATGVAALVTGVSNSAFSPSVDNVYGAPNTAFIAGPGAASGSVNGFFTQLNLYGVKTSYGVFTLSDTAAGTTSTANVFRVGYDVRF